MKNFRDKFLIFIAFLIIGITLSLKFNYNSSSNIFNMNTQQYKDAAEERTALYETVGDLKEENYNLKEKLESYNNSHQYSNTNIVEDMKSQLVVYNTLAGGTIVEGPGIIVKIEDGDYDLTTDSQEEVNRRTLHDIDATMVINQLRYIGAEAISINSYRILNNTGIICNWAFIGFDDENMETAPFYFYAIGDPDQLETAITAEGSYINELMIRKLKIEIIKTDNITINQSSKNIMTQYMERADR